MKNPSASLAIGRASCAALVDQLWRVPYGAPRCAQSRHGQWLGERPGVREFFCNLADRARAQHDPDDELCRVESRRNTGCDHQCIRDIRAALPDVLHLLPSVGPVPRQAVAADRPARPCPVDDRARHRRGLCDGPSGGYRVAECGGNGGGGSSDARDTGQSAVDPGEWAAHWADWAYCEAGRRFQRVVGTLIQPCQPR